MSGVLSDTISAIGAAAAGMAGMGLLMLVRPERWQANRSAAHDRKLADRLRRGTDAYFEELRTLKAYFKPSPSRTTRIFGAGLFILGVGNILLRFIKP